MQKSSRYLPRGWILPVLTEHNRPFFTSGELRIQQCMNCGAMQHPPGEICHECQSYSFDYVSVAAGGVVDSYTVVHYPIHSRLNLLVPYNVVVVVPDGHAEVRILGNLIDADPAELTIGQRVVGTWAEVADETAGETYRLLQWRLADHS